MFTAQCVQKAPKLICVMSLARAFFFFFFFLLWCWPKAVKNTTWKSRGGGWMEKSNGWYLVITLYLVFKSACCSSVERCRNSISLFLGHDRIVGTEKRGAGAPVSPSSSSHPVFVFTKEIPTKMKTDPSSSVGPCLHPWPASCPRSGGLTLVERSQLQQRATDPGPEEGGSDSEQRGWVRRHVLNWHSTVSMSWMVSVSTIMVKLSYLLSEALRHGRSSRQYGSASIIWVNKHFRKSLLSSAEKCNSDWFF